MLFLGLGTGLGSTVIVGDIVEPMELGHLPYGEGTYEDYVGLRGLKRLGKSEWRERVADVVGRLVAALEPDDVVLGGGDVNLLDKLPPGCRAGDNANAFVGGFRAWQLADRLPKLLFHLLAAREVAHETSEDSFSVRVRLPNSHSIGKTAPSLVRPLTNRP